MPSLVGVVCQLFSEQSDDFSNKEGVTGMHLCMITTTHLAARQADADDIALGGFDLAEEVALLLIGHPACFLRVVRFRLIDPLLLEGDKEVWGRIGIISLLGLRGWHLRFFFWALPAVN